MRLAADANVLLSAVLDGRAKAILLHPDVEEVVTAESVFHEVQEYASSLARKKRLSLDIVLLAVATLPLRVVAHEEYATAVPEAKKRIGKRDPDDTELLALAIQFEIPVWSNDNDFEDTGVECTRRHSYSRFWKSSNNHAPTPPPPNRATGGPAIPPRHCVSRIRDTYSRPH